MIHCGRLIRGNSSSVGPLILAVQVILDGITLQCSGITGFVESEDLGAQWNIFKNRVNFNSLTLFSNLI